MKHSERNLLMESLFHYEHIRIHVIYISLFSIGKVPSVLDFKLIKSLFSVLFTFCVVSSMAQHDSGYVDLEKLTLEQMDSMGYRNYPVPNDVYIRNYLGNVKTPSDKEVNKDELFLIGWSEDGYFAYVIEPYVENNDSYYAEIYIRDLKNDSIVWFSYFQNEAYEDAWNHANEVGKDSLRNVFTCYYLKCYWYSIYTDLSAALFKYGIVSSKENYDSRILQNQQKYNHTNVDTLDETYKVNIELFFEYDIDTFRFEYELENPVYGVNYHGYLSDKKVTDWCIMVVSERYPGLDSSSSETWRYRFLGFKRNLDLPFDTTFIALKTPGYYLHSDTVSKSYRKVSLIEQMGDRVVKMDEDETNYRYGNELDVTFSGREPTYSRGKKQFRDLISYNNIEYRRLKSIRHGEFTFYIFGEFQKDGEIGNATQLICYNTDSGDVAYWYDFTSLLEDDLGSIRWIESEDSLIYLSFGSDTVITGHKNYGKLLCIDTHFNRLLWQSESDCNNSESFSIVNDVIIGGFSSDDRDYICLINKITGETIRKITLLSDPLWVVKVGDNLHVRTRVANHEFKVESTFFESFDE